MNFRKLHKEYLDSDRIKVAVAKIEKVSQMHDKIVKSWFHVSQQDWGKYFVSQDQDYYLLESFARKEW